MSRCPGKPRMLAWLLQCPVIFQDDVHDVLKRLILDGEIACIPQFSVYTVTYPDGHEEIVQPMGMLAATLPGRWRTNL